MLKKLEFTCVDLQEPQGVLVLVLYSKSLSPTEVIGISYELVESSKSKDFIHSI